MKKEVVRINRRQCKANDTVPGSMSKLRGNPTSIKIDLINKRSVDQFQRLNLNDFGVSTSFVRQNMMERGIMGRQRSHTEKNCKWVLA